MADAFLKSSRRTFLAGSAAAIIAGAAPRRAWGQDRIADVLVVGAGLSGLNAAINLMDQGVDAVVVEGRDRVGGRIFSLKTAGNPEAGGNGVGGAYARIIDMIDRTKLKLAERAERTLPAFQGQGLHLNGRYIKREDWAQAAENIFKGERKALLPWEVVNRVIQPNNPFKDNESWFDPAFAKYDESLNDVLLKAGLGQEEIDLAYNIVTPYGSSSFDVSVMMLYAVGIFQRLQREFGFATDTKEVDGGNSQLPQAMAKLLKRPPILNKRVVGLRSGGEFAEARFEDGSTMRARYLICSMPLSAMRNIRFEPSLNGEFARAVKTVRYQKITQIHFETRERFWEKDERPAHLWSDTAAGRTLVMRSGVGGGPITLASWHNGMLAEMTDRLPQEAAKKKVQAAIEAYRPALKGKLKVTAIKSWQNDPFAGGAWAIWGPNQVQWAKATAEPLGRIHFCGEHTGLLSRGMESAMESGERAAIEVMEKLG